MKDEMICGNITKTINDLICGKNVENISDMINFNDSIIVGLSGGADSVALTHFLCELSDYFKLKIVACHVNHGIRGKEADKDQEFVRKFCGKLGIELLETKLNLLDVHKNSKQSLEEVARVYRYKFFRECSEKYNAKIATAHNMNDNAETVILNLIRGTGLKGICGIPKIRENIIRPLINFTRQDIEIYCKENSLGFVVDSTNLSVDYNRNLVRHKIAPVLSKININFASTISRNCDIILEEELFLEELTIDALNKISVNNGIYSVSEFKLLSSVIKNRVIKNILKSNNLPYSFKRINLIFNFILSDESNKMAIDDTHYLIKEDDAFYLKNIVDVKDNKLENFSVNLYQEESKKYINYKIIKYDDIKDEIIKNKAILKQCVDFDKILGEPVLRHRQNGDKIKLKYRHVTKSLKKLFNEEKLLPNEKDKLFVISDSLGVVWVEDFGADERVNVDENTKSILFLNI